MPFPTLTIGDKILPVPIIQGGMGIGVSMNNLAAAVARQGGIGVIAGALIGFQEKDIAKHPVEAESRALAAQIHEARAKSPGATGLLGINIMVALCNFAALVRTALAEKVDVIFAGAGLPLDLPAYLREAAEKAQEEIHTKLAPIVSSARAVSLIAKKWLAGYNRAPDLVVLEGPLAGGHLGFKRGDLDSDEHRLEVLVPQVVEALKALEDRCGRAIPLVAGGGVFTGEDIYKIMRLGASGVQMGTRFVATWECDASLGFKKTFLNAVPGDSMIIQSPVGMPGRAIRSQFLQDMENGLKKPPKCIYRCLKTCDPLTTPYCISRALVSAQRGDLEHGFAFAGANVGRVSDIVSVEKLMASLEEEFDAAASATRAQAS
ncbi:MAG: nitronate monooxygenase family protein [Candidatus Adiutrix sp.]|jgi:NAD(P)H-dependent flavin oxidoreductase YrpB (nitropropane dioxygenase family)|nr:nitronate monooxygenase family protein [Candidatus Adiutrix sp.]